MNYSAKESKKRGKQITVNMIMMTPYSNHRVTYLYLVFMCVYILGKSKEAERKRINKELANIRSKFKSNGLHTQYYSDSLIYILIIVQIYIVYFLYSKKSSFNAILLIVMSTYMYMYMCTHVCMSYIHFLLMTDLQSNKERNTL